MSTSEGEAMSSTVIGVALSALVAVTAVLVLVVPAHSARQPGRGTHMKARITLVMAIAAALAAALVPAGLAGQSKGNPASLGFASAVKTVQGSVGPDFTITLKLDGKKVTKLRAGVPYRFVVKDQSSIHDFHLTGPNLSKVITGIAFTGTKSAVLRLKAGTYQFVCDPHSSVMHGSFRVT
jgi:plastocyanin